MQSFWGCIINECKNMQFGEGFRLALKFEKAMKPRSLDSILICAKIDLHYDNSFKLVYCYILQTSTVEVEEGRYVHFILYFETSWIAWAMYSTLPDVTP